jgi:hypothetical protein
MRSHLHQFIVAVTGAARGRGCGIDEFQGFEVDHVDRIGTGIDHRAKPLQLSQALLGKL